MAVLRLLGDLGLVMVAGAACVSTTAVFLAFAILRSPTIDSVSETRHGSLIQIKVFNNFYR